MNENFIESIWEEAFAEALDEAETETGVAAKGVQLTWDEVFEKPYTL